MGVGTTKVVTITAYYSTGTILVQGVKCLAWVREEFDALIATARAIYALKTTNSSVDTNKEVEEGLRLLRPPSADRDGSEEASAPVCPPFIGALLKCIRPSSSTPPVTDCAPPPPPPPLPSSSCYGHRLQSLPKPHPRCPALWPCIQLSAAHPPMDQPSTDSSQPPPPRSELHKETTNKLSVLSFFHAHVTTIKANFLQHALDSTKANHSPPNKQSNCALSPGRCTL